MRSKYFALAKQKTSCRPVRRFLFYTLPTRLRRLNLRVIRTVCSLLRRVITIWGAGCLLTGCVVYQPMQCVAPPITGPRQGIVTGSTYLNGRVEAAAAYSPVRHLLVHAAYSKLADDNDRQDDSTYYRGRQYELGAGTYFNLGADVLLGGLAGFGRARSEAGYYNGGSLLGFGTPVRHDFDARYRKTFGEVYSAFQLSETVALGAAYRVTQIKFTTLTDRATPVDLRSMTRSEPMLFVRVRFGDGPANTRPVQLQMAFGSSSAFGKDGANAEPLGSRYALRQGRSYTSIGLTIFPHCLFRPAAGGATQ